MRRLALLAAAAALLLVPAAAPAHSPSHSPFPKLIALPDGWQPEGIAIKHKTLLRRLDPHRRASTAATCAAARAPRSCPPTRAAPPSGSKVHHKQLWVAGGPTGKAFVYDARTGADVAEYRPGDRHAVHQRRRRSAVARPTSPNSRAAEVFAVRCAAGTCAADRARRRLRPDRRPRPPTNLNGIARRRTAHDRRSCRSNTGKLFAADTRTGVARAIDLGGADVLNGDGILLRGRTLFVVQNRLNQIAGHPPLARPGAGQDREHDHRLARSTCRRRSPAHGRHLYAVNARFGTTDPQPAKYNVVRVP